MTQALNAGPAGSGAGEAPAVIYFCAECGVRIPASDLSSGKASRVDETRATCAACSRRRPATAAVPKLSEGTSRSTKRIPAPSGTGARPSHGVLQNATRSAPPSTRDRAPSPRPGAGSGTFLVIGIGGGLLVLICAVVFVLTRSGPPEPAATKKTVEKRAEKTATAASTTPTSPAPTSPSPEGVGKGAGGAGEAKPAPPPEEYDPRAAVAASLLAQAQAYLKSNPDDPWGYKEKLEELMAGYARTRPAAEAARLLGEVKLPPTPGPRAWWKLDEANGTTATDSSGNGKDGSLINGPVWTSGRDGGALSFNGSDSGVQAPSLGISGKLTIMAWINPGNLSGDRAIAGEDDSYALKTFGAQLRLTTPKVKDHDMAAALTTGAWQHVAVTFRAGAAGGVKFYKDGKLLGAVDASSLTAGSARFLIGQNQWTGQNFAGAIDDVRVYATCLSATEILDLYNRYGAAPAAATTPPANSP